MSEGICLNIINWDISFENLDDPKMFYFLYDLNTTSWDWKERTQEQKEFIAKHYIVFKLNGKIIWWCHLKTGERNFNVKVILECFRIKEKWCWFWTKALEKIKDIVWWNYLYTYSKKWEFFEKNWFQKVDWFFPILEHKCMILNDKNELIKKNSVFINRVFLTFFLLLNVIIVL